jgi:hypothetical protein
LLFQHAGNAANPTGLTLEAPAVVAALKQAVWGYAPKGKWDTAMRTSVDHGLGFPLHIPPENYRPVP